MSRKQILFTFTILAHILYVCFCTPKRAIIFHGFSNCAGDKKNPINFNGSVKLISRNIYELNGEVKVDERIDGPLEITAMRCNLDRSQCENFNTFILPDICKVFNQKNQIWTDIVAHSEPKPQCPAVPTTMKYTNVTIDFSLIAHLPLDGYTWVAHLKMFRSIPYVRHKKRLLFCLIVEATIVTNRQSGRKERTGRARKLAKKESEGVLFNHNESWIGMKA